MSDLINRIYGDFDKKNEIPKVKIPKFATGGICNDAIFPKFDDDKAEIRLGDMRDMGNGRCVSVATKDENGFLLEPLRIKTDKILQKRDGYIEMQEINPDLIVGKYVKL